MQRCILTAACPDGVGIVAAVSGFMAQRAAFIEESHHFGDPTTGRFFLRMVFHFADHDTREQWEPAFAQMAQAFQMAWHLYDAAAKTRTLILVSQHHHCLNDLLYRMRAGILPIDVPVVVGNHPEVRGLIEWHGIRFEHLSAQTMDRDEHDDRLLALSAEYGIELVVLARYMQILSPRVVRALEGRVINIHHSFLPSFKGAKPYAQAYDRGVKLIGATAHYVTEALDEGPIIDQDVERVAHHHTPPQLAATGRDIEQIVLARAVRAHVEHRVLCNGNKTVVFS